MISVIIVCKQIDKYLLRTIQSVQVLNPQILIDVSGDEKVPLGVRKNRLIETCSNTWMLVLDSDEELSPKLAKEIKQIVNNSSNDIYGYELTYQNYAFGKKIRYGGEAYAKVRLIQKGHGLLTPSPIHEEIVINEKIGKLEGVIHHYSYRSLHGVLFKFTKYAWQVAGEKRKEGEQVNLKKLFLYGPHMVWARAVKDEGWRDGWRGVVIALCFGYMEALTYWLLLLRNMLAR